MWQIAPLDGIKVTGLAQRKGNGGIGAEAGVPFAQELATECVMDMFVNYQHCHGNYRSEFFDFSEAKFSVLMLH